MSKIRAHKTGAWLARVPALALALTALTVYAQPIARFEGSGVVLTLYDEDCALKDQITNLPKRAVWTQDGKDIEGCFGVNASIGMVNLYFADKTATALPAQMFVRVTGA